MKITDHIKSRAIREHLKDHDFTMVEAAWVVWNSSLSMDEQNSALMEIANTMPDCTSEFGDSFGERLKRFVDGRIAKYLEITDKNNKYVYSVRGVDGARGIFFDDFKTCFDSALSKCFEHKIDFFTVTAHEKNTDNTFYVDFSVTEGKNIITSKFLYDEGIPEEFYEEWIFPQRHPFKKGDIVCISGWGEPMVVADDGSPIFVYMWDRGKIVCEDLNAYYMDHYNGLFEDENVTLLISRFLKTGEGLEDLLNEYHRCVSEKMNMRWEEGDIF